jgi:hypothetical protein
MGTSMTLTYLLEKMGFLVVHLGALYYTILA